MPASLYYDEQLIETAEVLLQNGGNNLASRHRAVSTAYYAVFHTLQFFTARSLLGPNEPENSPAFEEVFRLLNHDVFKETPTYFQAVNSDKDIQDIFGNCYSLKKARVEADYRVPKLVEMSLIDCASKVALAKDTIRIIKRVNRDQDKMRLLALSLLIKKPNR